MPRVDSDLGLSLPGECNKRVVTWGNNPKVTEEPALFRDSVFNDIGCCLDGSSSFLYMYFDNSGISSSQARFNLCSIKPDSMDSPKTIPTIFR